MKAKDPTITETRRVQIFFNDFEDLKHVERELIHQTLANRRSAIVHGPGEDWKRCLDFKISYRPGEEGSEWRAIRFLGANVAPMLASGPIKRGYFNAGNSFCQFQLRID